MNLRPGTRADAPAPREAQNRRDVGFARAAVVNRTHRVIREQALRMQEDRRRSRSLLLPVLICSALIAVICYAVWGMMDGYDLTPSGVPDASDQVLFILLWSLPITMVVLGMTWLQRRRNGNGEQTR